MNENHTIAMEIKTETYLGKGFFLFDIAFVFAFWFIMSNFDTLVYPQLKIVYTAFNILLAVALTRKSGKNPQKRIYEALIIYFLSQKSRRYHVKERIYANEEEKGEEEPKTISTLFSGYEKQSED